MFAVDEPEDWTFESVGVRGKIFSTEDLTTKAGFLLIETDTGHETTIVERDSDFVYYVLGGNGSFQIADSAVQCHPGQLVVVPHGSPFTYRGRLRMLLMTVPKWSADQESVV